MSPMRSLTHMGLVAAAETVRPVLAWFGLTTIRQTGCALSRSVILGTLLVGLCQAGQAQEVSRAPLSTPSAGSITLFQNVRIFDGKSSTLSGPRNVLVRGNQIARISTDPIAIDRSA